MSLSVLHKFFHGDSDYPDSESPNHLLKEDSNDQKADFFTKSLEADDHWSNVPAIGMVPVPTSLLSARMRKGSDVGSYIMIIWECGLLTTTHWDPDPTTGASPSSTKHNDTGLYGRRGSYCSARRGCAAAGGRCLGGNGCECFNRALVCYAKARGGDCKGSGIL